MRVTPNFKPRLPKKFRSQLIAHWLIQTFKPIKVADVGGGKGLLSHLLNEAGFDSTVIDPFSQLLPTKYKTLEKKRIKIADRDSITRFSSSFQPKMTKYYDLMIGIHLHGANIELIKSCARFKKDFLLIPCCVIGEPIEKEYGINWRKSLIKLAVELGLQPKLVQFNFAGRNIGIYTENWLEMNDDPRIKSDVLLSRFTG